MRSVKYSYEVALSRLMKQCSMMERCSGDIYSKLREWGFGDADAKKCLSTLVEQKFVDDVRYSALYVRDKSKFNGWGELKIRHMLICKGVDSDVVDRALSQNIDCALVSEKCYNLLERKLTILLQKSDDKYLLRHKLFAYAAGRGYKIELINKHINRLMVELK